MLTINKVRADHVIDFAAEELKKYLRMMMPGIADIPIVYDDAVLVPLGYQGLIKFDIAPYDSRKDQQALVVTAPDAPLSVGSTAQLTVSGGSGEGVIRYEVSDETIATVENGVMTFLKPGMNRKDVLINGVMGLCGESGEVIDIVKKWLAQGHELDRDKIIKELGDVAWYIAEIAHVLGVTLEEVLTKNIDKLKARYPEGFSTDNSVNRKDD